MKIVTIFEDRLYSCGYDDNVHEYRRLIDLWSDDEYLDRFYCDNKTYLDNDPYHQGHTLEKFMEDIWDDLDNMVDLLDDIENDSKSKLERFFQPLSDNEHPPTTLSLQKRRFKYLRLYAIRIDDDTFLITGGAIKITKTMQDHPETMRELAKLKNCKQYLQDEDIFDCDSFLEFVTE